MNDKLSPNQMTQWNLKNILLELRPDFLLLRIRDKDKQQNQIKTANINNIQNSMSICSKTSKANNV